MTNPETGFLATRLIWPRATEPVFEVSDKGESNLSPQPQRVARKLKIRFMKV